MIESSLMGLRRRPRRREYDRGILMGACICGGLVLLGVFFGGSSGTFVSPVSLLIVLGGTVGATLVHYSVDDIRHAWKAFKEVLHERAYDPSARIAYLVQLAHKIRREGLLILEGEAQRTGDSFMRMAFELTADAQDAEEVRRILETEMKMANDHAWRSVQLFETMGTYSPAMGLIGTLLGLIQMLDSLGDSAMVGPAMAVALITTLYGSLLSNMVFLPVAGKLKNRSEEQTVVKAITLEGVISLGKQENPIIVEQRLQSFRPMLSAA